MTGAYYNPHRLDAEQILSDLDRSDRRQRLGCSPATSAQEEGESPLQHGLKVLQDLLAYKRARTRFSETNDEFHSLFNHFIIASTGRRCLHLLFRSDGEPDLGSNWLTLDLEGIERQAKEAGHIYLALESDCFDAVLCTGLGRVSRPESLISELRRVLKRSGQIWIQMPLCGPYLPHQDDSTREYWRFTPDGLRVLMESFDEIFCSVYLPAGNALRTGSFFYGLKPPEASGHFTGAIFLSQAPPTP